MNQQETLTLTAKQLAQTAIRPITDTPVNDLNSSHIVDPDDPRNFYTYPWSVEPEKFAVSNGVAMGLLVIFLTTLFFIMVNTSCFKYLSFFVFDRHYKRLKIKVPENRLIKPNTPGQATPDEKSFVARMRVLRQPIVHFYSPLLSLATWRRPSLQRMPASVQIFNLVTRVVLLWSFSLIAALSITSSPCVFSRTFKNNSYECLNKFKEEETELSWETHMIAGLAVALVVAPFGFHFSNLIFKNVIAYAKIFAPQVVVTPGHVRNETEGSLGDFAEASSVFGGSQANSVSTQAFNATERASSFLNNSTQMSEKGHLIPKGLGPKYQNMAENNQLGAIDEDVDDEHESPVKPKRGIAKNSPFKKFKLKPDQDLNGSSKLGDDEKPLTINLNLVNMINNMSQSQQAHSARGSDMGDNDYHIEQPLKAGRNGTQLNSMKSNKNQSQLKNTTIGSETEGMTEYGANTQPVSCKNAAVKGGIVSRNFKGEVVASDSTIGCELKSPTGSSETPKINLNMVSSKRQMSAQPRFKRDETPGSLQVEDIDDDGAMSVQEMITHRLQEKPHPDVDKFINPVGGQSPTLPQQASSETKRCTSDTANKVVFLMFVAIMIFCFALDLYCFFNLTTFGLKLCMITTAFSVFFDALVQMGQVFVLAIHHTRVKTDMSLFVEKGELMEQVFQKYDLPVVIPAEEMLQVKEDDHELRPQGLSLDESSMVDLEEPKGKQITKKKTFVLQVSGVEVEVEDCIHLYDVPSKSIKKDLVVADTPKQADIEETKELTGSVRNNKSERPSNVVVVTSCGDLSKSNKRRTTTGRRVASQDSPSNVEIEEIPLDDNNLLKPFVEPMTPQGRVKTTSAIKHSIYSTSQNKQAMFETPSDVHVASGPIQKLTPRSNSLQPGRSKTSITDKVKKSNMRMVEQTTPTSKGIPELNQIHSLAKILEEGTVEKSTLPDGQALSQSGGNRGSLKQINSFASGDLEVKPAGSKRSLGYKVEVGAAVKYSPNYSSVNRPGNQSASSNRQKLDFPAPIQATSKIQDIVGQGISIRGPKGSFRDDSKSCLLEKQQSEQIHATHTGKNSKAFNSPRELNKKLADTSEKMNGSQGRLENNKSLAGSNSTTSKRRKLMFLEDAAASNHSFKYASCTNEPNMQKYGSILSSRESQDIVEPMPDLNQIIPQVDEKSEEKDILLVGQVQSKFQTEQTPGSQTSPREGSGIVETATIAPFIDYGGTSSKKKAEAKQFKGQILILKADSEVDRSSRQGSNSHRSKETDGGKNSSRSFERSYTRKPFLNKKVVTSLAQSKESQFSRQQTDVFANRSQSQKPPDLSKPTIRKDPFFSQPFRVAKSHKREERSADQIPKATAKTIASIQALANYARRPTTQYAGAELKNPKGFEKIQEQTIENERSPEKQTLGDSTIAQINKAKDSEASRQERRYDAKENKGTIESRLSKMSKKSRELKGNSKMNSTTRVTKKGSDGNRFGGSRLNSNEHSCAAIDFEQQDHYRETELSVYAQLVSAAGLQARMEDQKRRLEQFLTLARQARSKKDVQVIRGMIKELDAGEKPLPFARIQGLKSLALMASPYNQQLSSMIKVELEYTKQLRDAQQAVDKNQSSCERQKINRSLRQSRDHFVATGSKVVSSSNGKLGTGSSKRGQKARTSLMLRDKDDKGIDLGKNLKEDGTDELLRMPQTKEVTSNCPESLGSKEHVITDNYLDEL